MLCLRLHLRVMGFEADQAHTVHYIAKSLWTLDQSHPYVLVEHSIIDLMPFIAIFLCLLQHITANHYKVFLPDHLHPTMKHFCLDERDVHDHNAPIHRAWGPTEWFQEYENDVNHMLWCSQSSDHNPPAVQVLSTAIIKTAIEELSFERTMFMAPVQL